MRKQVVYGAMCGAVVLASLACGVEDSDATLRPPLTMRYDEHTGRLQEVTYDRHGDGKPDAWLFMDGTHLLRAEMDEDGDGVVDRWEHYIPAGSAAAAAGSPHDGSPIVVESSRRPDGVIDRRERYDAGVLTSTESDTDGDGRFDKWETYVEGRLAQLELALGSDATADTDGRLRPTRRLVYGEGGVLVRLEVDTDRDGVFEPVGIDEPRRGEQVTLNR